MPVTTDPPLHRAVADDLRRRIASGEVAVGAALPSEAQLMAETGASRGTVRQALGALRAEGLIGGGRGRPPVVRSSQVSQPFDACWSFTRWAHGIGRTPGQRTLELARRPAGPDLALGLVVEEGAPVVEVLRLRTLDGIAAMVERAAFVEPVGRLLFDADLDGGSIYSHLRSCGVDLAVAVHRIDAVAADERDADLLGLAPGAPLLRELRTTSTGRGEVIELSDDRYRPDVVSFTIEHAVDQPAVGGRWLRTATPGTTVDGTAPQAPSSPRSDRTERTAP